MLPNGVVLSQLLDCLYDAAANPALWEIFLQKLANHSGATSAALVMHDNSSNLHAVARNWEVDPEGTRLYQQYFGALDIWAKRATGIAMREWVGTSDQLCPFSEFARSEYYNDFLRSIGVAHAAFALLQRSSSGDEVVGIYRPRRLGQFEESDLDLLRFLTPHIKRASSLHLHISELKARAITIASAFDMIPAGVILVGAKGKIAHANRAASEILAQADGLLATSRGLRAQHPAESAELEALIGHADLTYVATGVTETSAMSISRRKQPKLQLLITPMRCGFPFDEARVRAVVFVNDPTRKVRLPLDVLRRLFSLSPAECRLALLLADGKAPPQIADIVGVSANTLKSQLASIYRKTGTSRQAQIARLVLQLGIVAGRPEQSLTRSSSQA
jgi:DNA-binding CsgD family transcriptional regulator